MDPVGFFGSAPLQLYVYNCTFRNNSVGIDSVAINSDDSEQILPPPPNNNNTNDDGGGGGKMPTRLDMFDAVGGVVTSQQFTSRGGGLAVIVNDEKPVDVVVFGCNFRENAALAFGGGMYVGLDGMSRHSVVINHTE